MNDPRNADELRGTPERSGVLEAMGEDPGGLGAELARALLAELEGALGEALLVFDAEGRCRAAGPRAHALLGVPGALTLADLEARLGEQAPDDSAAFEGREEEGDGARALARTGAVLTLAGRPVGRLERLREAEAASVVDRARFEREAGREHRRAQRSWSTYAVALVAPRSPVAEAPGADASAEARLGAALVGAAREYDLVARWDAGAHAWLLPGADAAATRAALGRALGAWPESAGREGAGPESSPALVAGVAVWTPPSGERPEDLVRRAASALERARARAEGLSLLEVEVDASEGDFGGDLREP